MEEQTILMVDVQTMSDAEDLSTIIAHTDWTMVYFLLVPSPSYVTPSFVVCERSCQPAIRNVLVPEHADPYSFAAGFLHAKHPDECVCFVSNQKESKLFCLDTANVRLIRKAKGTPSEEEEEEEEGDTSDAECDHQKPENTMMKSVLEFIGTPQGQKLLVGMLGNARSKQ